MSKFRNHSNLQNSNYYHLGPRNGNGNYHMMENPYNTTLSVPIAQSLQGGYNNARVSERNIPGLTIKLIILLVSLMSGVGF